MFEFINAWDKSIFSPGKRNSAQRSLLTTHIRCILDAKVNRYNKTLICEDDVNFRDDLHNLFVDFLKVLPDDWDYLQFGNQFWATHWLTREKIKDNLYRFFWGTGSHCIGINSKVYNDTLKELETFYEHTDFIYYRLFKNHKCYCPELFLADAISDTSHMDHHEDKQIFKSMVSGYKDTMS
jgi:GR25 family glycosyltransferase involved in LPS biosynthesis